MKMLRIFLAWCREHCGKLDKNIVRAGGWGVLWNDMFRIWPSWCNHEHTVAMAICIRPEQKKMQESRTDIICWEEEDGL